MTPRNDRFLLIIALLYVVGGSVAIYDPKATTVKPPKRREPVLPWYLAGEENAETADDFARSPKWRTDTENPTPRKPTIVDSGTKSWSPWRKISGSEIEQRTVITDDDGPPQTNVDQTHDQSLAYDQFETQENRRFPPGPDIPAGSSQKVDCMRSRDWEKYEDESDEDKIPSSDPKRKKCKTENDFYEGVPDDSTKPHKDKLISSSRPKLTVARYDASSGVQCPEVDSTGQFVYPPDCKFFVNCWKGRAFVQPCAPGTLFNPDTLECDFPHKVKCYGGELADFQSSYHLDSSGKREPLLSAPHSQSTGGKLQVIRCPEHVTGMLAHPSDCTKFLQCTNGGTIVMDCGPGTVFNPALSVCDWPRNVKGCEDAFKPDKESGSQLTPPNPPKHRNYDHERFEFGKPQEPTKIKCPPDYTGLLPHPETCKKFLQCANGITYVMDCGPGTAFNPLISVCDWPYNVPGCSEDKPIVATTPRTVSTTARPWPPYDFGVPRPGENRYNNTSHTSHVSTNWPHGSQNRFSTTTASSVDWDSRWRPTWKPTWKPSSWTTTTPASRVTFPGHRPGSHDTDYYNRHPSEADRHREHDRFEPHAESSNRRHGADNDFNRPNGQWSDDHMPPGHTYHYHHHHHHHNPSYDHRYPERADEGTQRTDESWRHDSNRHTPPYNPPHDHHSSHYNPWLGHFPTSPANVPPEDSDRQRPQAHSGETHTPGHLPGEFDRDRFDRRTNTARPEIGNLPPNRRIDQEFTSDRREYGRVAPGFPQSGFPGRPIPDGNYYVDKDYDLSTTQRPNTSSDFPLWYSGSRNRTTIVWPVRNVTVWTKPGTGNQRFVPSTWNQQYPGGSTQGPQNRQWNQGTEEQTSQKWDSSDNVYQQGNIDKEADSRLDQWMSKPNIFLGAKGQAQPGVKDTSQNSRKDFYPHGIYVNVNGTRGHFITKEIEVNQGHSKTKTYRPNELEHPNDLNKTHDTRFNSTRSNRAFITPNIYTSNETNINYNFARLPTLFQPFHYNASDRSFGHSTNSSRVDGFYKPTFELHKNNSSMPDDLSGGASTYPIFPIFTNNRRSDIVPFPLLNVTAPIDSLNRWFGVLNHEVNRTTNNFKPTEDYLFSILNQPNSKRPNTFAPTINDMHNQFTPPFVNVKPPSRNPFIGFANYSFPNAYVPFINFQIPYYQHLNRSFGFFNFLDVAGTGNRRTNMEPSNYPSHSQGSSSTTKFTDVSNHYPTVPARELQPPFYDPDFSQNQYPPIPASDLQPPFFEPTPSPFSPSSTRSPSIQGQYPFVPASDLQPPYYEPRSSSVPPTSTESPKVQSQYPAVPSLDLEPPFYEPPKHSSIPPTSTESPKLQSQYPAVPSLELQPPYPESVNGTTIRPKSDESPKVDSQYPVTPATSLEPPYRSSRPSLVDTHYPTLPPINFLRSIDFSNSTTSPSYNGDNPTTPVSVPKPPYRSVDTSSHQTHPTDLSAADSNHRFTFTRNTTQRDVDKHVISSNTNKVFEVSTKAPRNVSTTVKPDKPTVSIGRQDNFNFTEFDDVVEPGYDVDVLDEKEIWKPVLVFENKTRTTTVPSVVMRINKKKTDVDLFNIEAAPFDEDEPPFPVYYVPPVQPLDHLKQSNPFTPISGQVIRLRGGSGPHDGYVEVQGSNPGWGIVCDTRNSWTLKEAHVVCKQLGYARGAEMAWQGRTTRNGVPTWIAANSVTCSGNETRFQSCKFTHEQECRVERDAIGVRCVPNRVAHCRNDEIPYEGQCYHLADPDSGLNHAEALEYCTRRQSRLIDITSQPENDFVSEWLLQAHPEVGSIMTSGVGFTTFNRTIWLWEDSSRAKFRFAKWWPGWMEDKKHPPWVGSRPVCIVMKRKFPCHERPDSICVADYFFWDTEDCATSMKGHSYICKRPYDDIGCIYGKGNQYSGNANVTASGKPCLPWAHEKLAHQLRISLINPEAIQKLKTHNYCRNPNPNKESRPWCFTQLNAEREYCDIPPCGNVEPKKSFLTGECKPKHFECLPGECIPSPWVCDGEEDCTNGADERMCTTHLNLFQKHARHKLEGYDVEKWLNTPLKTCALRCKEADFTCRSFAHKTAGNICLLSDSNVGMTGALKPNKEFDYYEMKERSINCNDMYVCGNKKCINQTQVCNGKNDCHDRTDESICTVENLDYAIRLAGSNSSHEGRIEVKILGVWGQVCDDGFGMIDADVICKELGFSLGALEIRPGGFYGNLDPPTRFMVDQLKCRGNETSLRECDFDGWGVHNCQPEEAVGVVCKTAVDSCQENHWKCDNSPVCIPTPFICDEVVDCPDGSDESSAHCNAPFEIRLANGTSRMQGRVEVRHHGVWGTVCDDDFSNATAAVICRSLGYGGIAIAKKDGFFGPGEGPIWLDEVFCHGNESQLSRCEHNHWGQHNCDHNEDAGVICTPGDVNHPELFWETVPEVPELSVNDLLPADCGKRSKDFDDDDDLIFARVVRGSIAPKGTYPWQASIRVRGHSRSSHWCGAVILSPLHVLTAAHCLQGYNKGSYFVRAGDYNTEIDEGTEVEANIQDYYIHEDFRKGHRMNNDIALVLLKGRGIPLGKDIMPICLPPENIEYPPGLNCTISGFGSIETGKSTHSKDLRYGWIPLLDQSVCRAGYIYGEGAISDGMVCAGYLDEGVDTCDGDSGGPLACYHNGAFTLYGITSWGQHCGKANKPGVYVRVSYYRRWIEQKIKESLGGR